MIKGNHPRTKVGSVSNIVPHTCFPSCVPWKAELTFHLRVGSFLADSPSIHPAFISVK
ncbi:hypothetical protein N431DRAFT_431891, partial [Stipitochalara longipes BDJ]